MDLVEALGAIEPLCSRAEFNRLCYCLTLDSLHDHPQYSDWSPAKGRLACFQRLHSELAGLFQAEIDAAAATSSKPMPGRLLELLARAGMEAMQAARSAPAKLADELEEDAEEMSDVLVFDPVTDTALLLSTLQRRPLASAEAINAAGVVRAAKRREQRERRREAAGAAPGDDIRASVGALRRTLRGGRGSGAAGAVPRAPIKLSATDAEAEAGGAGAAGLLRSSAGWAQQLLAPPKSPGSTRAPSEADLAQAADSAAAAASLSFSPGRAATRESGGLGGRSSLSGEEVSAVRALLGRSIGADAWGQHGGRISEPAGAEEVVGNEGDEYEEDKRTARGRGGADSPDEDGTASLPLDRDDEQGDEQHDNGEAGGFALQARRYNPGELTAASEQERPPARQARAGAGKPRGQAPVAWEVPADDRPPTAPSRRLVPEQSLASASPRHAPGGPPRGRRRGGRVARSDDRSGRAREGEGVDDDDDDDFVDFVGDGVVEQAGPPTGQDASPPSGLGAGKVFASSASGHGTGAMLHGSGIGIDLTDFRGDFRPPPPSRSREPAAAVPPPSAGATTREAASASALSGSHRPTPVGGGAIDATAALRRRDWSKDLSDAVADARARLPREGVASLTLLGSFRDPERRPVRCASFDPTGSLLAAGFNTSAVRLLSMTPAILGTGVADAHDSPSRSLDPSSVSADAAAWPRERTLAVTASKAPLPVAHEWTGLHSGSVYDLDWSSSALPATEPWSAWCGVGDGSAAAVGRLPAPALIATGSNDATSMLLGVSYTAGAGVGGIRAPEALGACSSSAGKVRLTPECGSVRAVCFIGDGLLVTGGGSTDCALRLWDTSSAAYAPVSEFAAHTATVHAIARCQDAADGACRAVFASTGDDRTVRLWDARARAGSAAVTLLGSLAAPANALAHTAQLGRASAGAGSSGLVAVGMANGTVVLSDSRMAAGSSGRDRVLCREEVHTMAVRSLDFSPDGAWLASASFDKTCCVMSVAGGAATGELQVVCREARVHEDRALCIRWHPWAPVLASTGADGLVCVSTVSA